MSTGEEIYDQQVYLLNGFHLRATRRMRCVGYDVSGIIAFIVSVCCYELVVLGVTHLIMFHFLLQLKCLKRQFSCCVRRCL